jgi:hypothetical protein
MYVSFHTSFFFPFIVSLVPCCYSPGSFSFFLFSFCPLTFPFVLFRLQLFFPSSVPLLDPLSQIVSHSLKIILLFFLKRLRSNIIPSALPFSLSFLLLLSSSYLLFCVPLGASFPVPSLSFYHFRCLHFLHPLFLLLLNSI